MRPHAIPVKSDVAAVEAQHPPIESFAPDTTAKLGGTRRAHESQCCTRKNESKNATQPRE